MLTSAELKALRQQPGVTIGIAATGNVEWTGALASAAVAIEMYDGGNVVAGAIGGTTPASVPFCCLAVPALAT